jgi:hypothetical protein
VVAEVQAKREAVVWRMAEIRLCQPEQQWLEMMMFAAELHAQRWQLVHAIDGSDDSVGASQLRWHSRL